MKSQKIAVGTRLMVPFYGVCEVVAADSELILGQDLFFYQLKPAESNTLLKIPANQFARLGIRSLASPGRLATILGSQPDGIKVDGAYAHQRMTDWKNLLRSGETGCRLKLLVKMDSLEKEGIQFSLAEQDLRKRALLSFRHELELVLDLSASEADRLVNEAVAC